MSRRAAKKDLTRTQILSAAADLFAEQGYEQTSIDEIAKKADIAKGTFYYHFESKEDVVIALRKGFIYGYDSNCHGVIEQWFFSYPYHRTGFFGTSRLDRKKSGSH